MMKLSSFLSLVLITGFLFMAVIRLHPVGEPLGSSDVFKDRGGQVTDVKNVSTMDDYYLRNGQRETGSNNIVTSVVFDYRGFDTLGEATVLFVVVSAVTMLLLSISGYGKAADVKLLGEDGFPANRTRIVTIGSFILYPIIIAFGAYLVVHGHLSPGGGFQGGAVLGTATALLIVSAFMTKKFKSTYKIFSFFESFGLTMFICLGFAGLGGSFLLNFLANGDPMILGRVIEMGPNPGYLNSGGILPLLSIAVGMEVFCGISIILIFLNRALYQSRAETKGEERGV